MAKSEDIRRDFALAWGKVGAAWGVAPSTAAVQGYLLVDGGALTEAELRAALGLSHRATLIALSECESWGLIRPAEPKRTGRRGPAGRSWSAVPDHWEWFLRVAGARKERETDPVLPLLDECLRRAIAANDDELAARVGSLVTFTHQFDRAAGAVIRTAPAAIGRLFAVMSHLDEPILVRLFNALASVQEEELAAAAKSLATMRPPILRALVRLASARGVGKLLRAGG